MADKIPADIKKLSFEAALQELETIVSELEAGDVDLEKSIQVYERGTALKAHCEAKLREAEMKVEKITLGSSGAVKGSAAANLDVD
ncbi:exodeoxyribonuclease VII small subunit [Pyruvatibacter sp.]|uniref:exodeoxyribonuclease VII small subunit n=1 Tax=unclassified Pyruvatibacter TaxID=2618840 RepID=UPI00310AF4B1